MTDNKLPFLVIGAGGHAAVIISALRSAGVDIHGALDVTPDRRGEKILGIEILGDESLLANFSPKSFFLANGIGDVGARGPRRTAFETWSAAGYRFPEIVHASAIVDSTVDADDGCQVMAGAVIQPRTRIGRNSLVNTGASVDHDCTLGDNVHVAPGATLSGTVTIGSDVMIGAGATVIQNITIGDNAFVSAGATVINDVAPATRVGGIPAKEF